MLVCTFTYYHSLVCYFIAVWLVADNICEWGGAERCTGLNWSILVDFFFSNFGAYVGTGPYSEDSHKENDLSRYYDVTFIYDVIRR